jgi:hypothetical protein
MKNRCNIAHGRQTRILNLSLQKRKSAHPCSGLTTWLGWWDILVELRSNVQLTVFTF